VAEHQACARARGDAGHRGIGEAADVVDDRGAGLHRREGDLGVARVDADRHASELGIVARGDAAPAAPAA
jgi:hypothetical protein